MVFFKDKNILVVDDEADLREMLISELQTRGIKPFEAENGIQALKLIQENPIDLVISDIRMPHGNGIDLLKESKTINLKKPIFIFITAYADYSIEELYSMGAEAIYSKPFDLPKIINSFAEYLKPFEIRYSKVPNGQIETEFTLTSDNYKESHSNLGRGGAIFQTGKRVFNEGTLLKFSLSLQKGENIQGIGSVVWCESSPIHENEFCVGIEFLYFEPEYLQTALKVLQDIKTLAYIPKRPPQHLT